jgi:hypothetical protein
LPTENNLIIAKLDHEMDSICNDFWVLSPS